MSGSWEAKGAPRLILRDPEYIYSIATTSYSRVSVFSVRGFETPNQKRNLPVVSIVVPCFIGSTSFLLRILWGNPEKRVGKKSPNPSNPGPP